MLDVIVHLIHEGSVVNGYGESRAIRSGDARAALGSAVIGTMRLGAA